jgi:hypothetical protein
MAGGLLNLVSYGQDSLLLYGNPQKTFFKTTYKRFTNFGMQKFRIDYEGSKQLRMTTETRMEFKIPRYAELLYDSYVVVNLPNIWSPLYYNEEEDEYVEYGFKWIENIGTNFLKEIEIQAGGQILAKYSGEYNELVMERDGTAEKKDLWNRMTGNIPELNDPANAYSRINTYPNAYFSGSTNIRPSIYGRKLFIPINAWFSNNPGMAFPLISTQYVELSIIVTFRPIKELYIIRDVKDLTNNYPYIAPNINLDYQKFYHFLNPPDSSNGDTSNTNEMWNSDIHLLSTYIFLDNQEAAYFASRPQKYLIKDVYEWNKPNIYGSQIVDIDSRGLIASYMLRFRRNDAYLRNAWSNYTNWPYNTLPYEIDNSTSPDSTLFITGNYNSNTETQNNKEILQNMALLLDGKYRENVLDGGVYNYVEKYLNTKGGAKDGIYIYSFALNTDNRASQPSGAMNMNKFENIQFEINTIEPPLDPSATFVELCDSNGNIIGTRKNMWDLNEYSFDLVIFEERYNMLVIESGLAGLMYARG